MCSPKIWKVTVTGPSIGRRNTCSNELLTSSVNRKLPSFASHGSQQHGSQQHGAVTQPDMKRKSAQDRPAKRKKSIEVANSSVLIREGVDFTHVGIPPGKAVVFSGNATLEVTSGCVQVYGYFVTPGRGLVKLTAPSRYSKALLITAVAEASQAPLAQSTAPAQVILHATTGAATGGGFPVVDKDSSTGTAVWQVPQQWSQATDTLCATLTAACPAPHPLVIAITGSKGSGKSSLARLLVNSLLNICAEVAFLDLDPGQPELTPPGLLSLHLLQHPLFGPPHVQHQQPLLAYFQGDISSQSEPARYLQTVQSLCSRFQSMAVGAAGQASPLVINTPGWITGLGLELLVEILRCAEPTHVLNMQLPNSKKNLPDGCWWLDSNTTAAAAAGAVLPTVLQLPSVSTAATDGTAAAAAASGGTVPAVSCYSVPSGDTGATTNLGGSSGGKSARTLSAVESRALSWLVWSQRVIHSSSNSSNNSGNAEVTVEPVNSTTAAAGGSSTDEFAAAAGLAAAGLAAAVPYEVSLRDLEIQLLHAQVDPSEIAFAVNGAVVGLVSNSSQQQQHNVAKGEISACLGLGLVRAVDAKNGVLYLLTDLPEDQLDLVDTLVVGRLEFPEKLLVTQRFATPYQGLYCLTSTATGAGVIRARNNLLRASLLRG